MTALYRLMVSDRSALRWYRDQAISGTEDLDLQHLYRAMGWLGEVLPSAQPVHQPGVLRRHLAVLYRSGWRHAGSVRQEPPHDCRQVVPVIDGDGVPVCSALWPGNTTDVTPLHRVSERLQRRFGVRRVCLVADAGLISKKMVAAVEARGWLHILGRRTREVLDVILNDAGAFETVEVERQRPEPMQLQVKEVTVDDTAGAKPRRYVVCRNPVQVPTCAFPFAAGIEQ